MNIAYAFTKPEVGKSLNIYRVELSGKMKQIITSTVKKVETIKRHVYKVHTKNSIYFVYLWSKKSVGCVGYTEKTPQVGERVKIFRMENLSDEVDKGSYNVKKQKKLAEGVYLLSVEFDRRKVLVQVL